jgi:hypothetical protein
MRNVLTYIRLRLLKIILWQRPGRFGSVGNRRIYTFKLEPLEITVTSRDTTEEDGYSRVELYNMLKLIRTNEVVQQWRVPEPVGVRFVLTEELELFNLVEREAYSVLQLTSGDVVTTAAKQQAERVLLLLGYIRVGELP